MATSPTDAQLRLRSPSPDAKSMTAVYMGCRTHRYGPRVMSWAPVAGSGEGVMPRPKTTTAQIPRPAPIATRTVLAADRFAGSGQWSASGTTKIPTSRRAWIATKIHAVTRSESVWPSLSCAGVSAPALCRRSISQLQSFRHHHCVATCAVGYLVAVAEGEFSGAYNGACAYGQKLLWSPRSQASRRPGVARSQSARMRRVMSRRSLTTSSMEGLPQYQ